MNRRFFGIIGLMGLFIFPAFPGPASFASAGKAALFPASSKQKGASPAGIKRFKVDVVALKDGLPVVDLAPSDFDLFEDDEKVPLHSVSYVPAASRKRLAVIFHDMNLWIKNVQRDKDDITEELVALSHLGIEMTLMRLDSPGGLRIIQPLTRDETLIRKASAAALDKVGMNESYDALGIRVMEFEGAEALIQKEARNQLLSFYYTKRLRFEKTVGGLMAACFGLLDSPGRKSVLLISGGIPDISSASRTAISQSTAEAGLTATSDQKRETLDAIHDRSQQTPIRSRVFDPFGLLKGETFERGDQVLKKLIQFSNTLNVSIYSLDPGVFTRNVFVLTPEFVRPEQGTSSDSVLNEDRAREVQNLREISEGTSGLLFRGADKFSEMKRGLGSDLEGYYELEFQAEGKKPDGKYHKITVKTSREDVDLRFRKGYRELTPDEAKNMLLVSAYYSPELFSSLPFQALFVPVVEGSGKIASWITLALPVKPVFLETARASSPQTTFTLNVWLREHDEEKRGFATDIGIPVKMTDSLRASLPSLSHLWTYFKGPELAPKKTAYDAILVLQDAATGEIGGWSSPVVVPDLRSRDQAAMVGCVLGSVAENSPAGQAREAVFINPKNGTLEFGGVRFYPRVTNRFTAGQDAWVFIQAYLPLRKGKDAVSPRFMAVLNGAGASPGPMAGEIISEFWNDRAKVWSGLSRLELGMLADGEYVLKVELPASPEAGGMDLTSEIRFIKAGYAP